MYKHMYRENKKWYPTKFMPHLLLSCSFSYISVQSRRHFISINMLVYTADDILIAFFSDIMICSYSKTVYLLEIMGAHMLPNIYILMCHNLLLTVTWNSQEFSFLVQWDISLDWKVLKKYMHCLSRLFLSLCLKACHTHN